MTKALPDSDVLGNLLHSAAHAELLQLTGLSCPAGHILSTLHALLILTFRLKMIFEFFEALNELSSRYWLLFEGGSVCEMLLTTIRC